MTTIKTTIEHNGKTYTGQIGTIKGTSLGNLDHGMTATLHVDWRGGGISAGGICLDDVERDAEGKFVRRVGSAYGLDHIMRILETVGVEKWEDLPGKQIIVIFDGRGGPGSISCGIAGTTNEKVLDFKAHFEAFKKSSEVKE